MSSSAPIVVSESVEDVQSLPPSMVAGPSSPRPSPVPVEVRERERSQPVDILAEAAVALRNMAELLDTDDGSGEVAISDESVEDTLVCSNLAVGLVFADCSVASCHHRLGTERRVRPNAASGGSLVRCRGRESGPTG